MKTQESRFQVHDDLTAPERSLPVLKGALAAGGQLSNFIAVLSGSPAALRAYVDHYIRSQQWINEHRSEWVQKYYVENQGITAADGQRIVDSLGQITFPRLDAAVVARQQATIDVIDRAGELPKKVRASDGFDLRFDQVVTTTVPAVGAAYGPAGAS